MLDDLHLLGWKTIRVRRLAREFIEHHVGPDDLVLLAATSGRAHLTQEFTADKGRILQAIDRFVGLADGPVNQDESTYNTRSVLATVENLARHFAGLRGRRTAVIFISEAYGLPEPGSGEFPGSLGRSDGDVIAGHFKAIEALRNSNVTLYSIDPRGLDEEAMKEKRSRDTLHELAGATGGFATTLTNDFAPSFDRIIQEASHYYLLGYYPAERRSEGQFRPIEVRVRRPGVRISNRPGYIYRTPPAPAATRAAAAKRPATPSLASLLDSPLPTPGLPLRVQAVPLQGSGSNARVQLIVEAGGKDLAFNEAGGRFIERIEFATVSYDALGRRSAERVSAVNLRLNADERDRTLRTGVRWISLIELPRGRHDLRVAGHALTSNLRGSVFADVDVPRFDTEMTTSGLAITSLTAASLFTTGGPILLPPLPSPPTVRRSFTLGDVLAVSAEIYRPSQRTMLLVRKPGEMPSEFFAQVSEAAPPQRVVSEQPLPVMTNGHKTPYVSFAINTKMLGAGRFVLRLVRRSGTTPADEAPGAVLFEVVAK